jgi:hypothetical protein
LWDSVEEPGIWNVTDSPALMVFVAGKKASEAMPFLSKPALTTLPVGVASATSCLASLFAAAACLLIVLASSAFDGAFEDFLTTCTVPFIPGWIEQ